MNDGDATAVVADTTPPPAPTYTPEDAEEAKAFGWKSPDEWEGEKPAGYIDDPKRYMERAGNFRPFKALKEQQAKLEADFTERARKLEAMAERSMELQKQQFDAERTRLMADRKAAVEIGDVAQFDKIDAQIDKLKAPEPVAVTPTPPASDPYVAEYVAKNEWLKDPMLYDWAKRAIDLGNMANRPPAEQIAYAEAKVKEFFPHKFPTDTKAPPADLTNKVDGGGLGIGTKDAFGKLPQEARAQFARDVKRGLFTDDAKGRAAFTEAYNEA